VLALPPLLVVLVALLLPVVETGLVPLPQSLNGVGLLLGLDADLLERPFCLEETRLSGAGVGASLQGAVSDA
jgi:hypothetical protein